jgi:hypothetical protein
MYTVFTSKTGKSRIQIYEGLDGLTIDFSSMLKGYPNFTATKEEVNFSSFRSNENLKEFFQEIYFLHSVLSNYGQNIYGSIIQILENGFIPTFSEKTGEEFIKVEK